MRALSAPKMHGVYLWCRGGHFLLSVPGVDGFSLCAAQGGHLSISRVICNFSELIPGATGHLSESIPGATGQVRVMCAFHSFYLARPPFPTLLLCLTHFILLYILRGWTASQFLIISHLTQLRAASPSYSMRMRCESGIPNGNNSPHIQSPPHCLD